MLAAHFTADRERFQLIRRSGYLLPLTQIPAGQPAASVLLDGIAGDDVYVFFYPLFSHSTGSDSDIETYTIGNPSPLPEPPKPDIRKIDTRYGFVYHAETLVTDYHARAGVDLIQEYRRVFMEHLSAQQPDVLRASLNIATMIERLARTSHAQLAKAFQRESQNLQRHRLQGDAIWGFLLDDSEGVKELLVPNPVSIHDATNFIIDGKIVNPGESYAKEA